MSTPQKFEFQTEIRQLHRSYSYRIALTSGRKGNLRAASGSQLTPMRCSWRIRFETRIFCGVDMDGRNEDEKAE